MDHFGIGTVLQGITATYFQSARRTGRTTSLVESVQPGDVVVFWNNATADHFKRLAKAHGKEVRCVVAPKPSPGMLVEKLGGSVGGRGRLLFDHSWVEQFYLARLEQSRDEIDHWQRELSGYGSTHVETRMQAEALYRYPK